jgi:hypothetical protein
VYVGGPKAALDEAVYQLLRHGIAHCYAGKPRTLVTRHQPTSHLSTAGETLYVDADALASDFRRAYSTFRVALDRDSVLSRNAEENMKRLNGEYWSQSDNVKKAIRKNPATHSHFRGFLAPSGIVVPADVAVNSPSVDANFTTIELEQRDKSTSSVGRSDLGHRFLNGDDNEPE